MVYLCTMQKLTATNESINTLKAIALGVLATFFLSMTFIANSMLATGGGHWAWTTALRYLLLLPILVGMLSANRKLKPLLHAMRQSPRIWLRWGTWGFGVFYACLSYASLLAPGWLVAATFQTTVLAGLLIAPFIYKDHRAKVPKKALLISSLIVSGIMVMQVDNLGSVRNGSGMILSFALALGAAFLWPLGNRKLLLELEKQDLQLNATQRVLGMTFGCVPLLLVFSGLGFYQAGLPKLDQVYGSLITAVCSGILGGILFYKAVQMVKHNPVALATVEATQVIAILFTLLAEVALKGVHWPGFYGNLGLLIILIGVGCHFILSYRYGRRADRQHKPSVCQV